MAPCHGCFYLINKSYWFFLQKVFDFISPNEVPLSSHQGDVNCLTGHLLPLLPSLPHLFSHHHQSALFIMQMRSFYSPA